MNEPDPATCRNALLVLLHKLAPEQRAHATGFLLGHLEGLYLSAGVAPPDWINVLRASLAWPEDVRAAPGRTFE